MILHSSFSPEAEVGVVSVVMLEDMLDTWPFKKLLLQGYCLNVPVPLVIEEVKDSVGVGVSLVFIRLLVGETDENDC